MKQKVVVLAVGAVALALLWSTLIARAAEQPYPVGTLLTVAGNGKGGSAKDGTPALQAPLNYPTDLTLDAAGTLYLVDHGNSRVRKVGPDGILRIVQAGVLLFPTAVAVGPGGDLFISDAVNGRIRKVSASGTVTTVAGGGKPADGVGDGGLATAARLKDPEQLAFDAGGNLLIADDLAGRIRKVDPAGMISTVAGGGKPADGRGDGGLATAASLKYPGGVAVDSLGNVYISDWTDTRVRKVSTDGKIVTVAGGGQPADGVGDGGLATDARLDGPVFITVDAGGNLFIAENRGERIRKVSPAGLITTVAGNGKMGRTGDGGMATAAALNSPTSVAVDQEGNLYFAEGPRWGDAGIEDDGNNLIRKVIGVATPGALAPGG